MRGLRDLVVDFGGTNIRVAHMEGDLLEDLRTYPSRAELDSDGLRDHFLGVLEDYITDVGLRMRLAAINIAIAGQIDCYAGLVRASPNLPSWRQAPLADWVRDRFAVDVYVDNDVRAAALGEMNALGLPQGGDIVCLYWGTGIGGGIVVSGKLLRGLSNAAAEVGHMVYVPDGRLCTCGKRGCFEAYAGGWAIQSIARERAALERDAALHPTVTTADVFRLADEKHVAAEAIRDDATRALGILASNLVVLFNPSRLVLGGGITAHHPHIRDIVAESIERNVLTVDKEGLQVVLSTLGDKGALLGAASLRNHR